MLTTSDADDAPLKLKQWDWKQDLEASRRSYQQRDNVDNSAPPVKQELNRERSKQRQLSEQQRRDAIMQPHSHSNSGTPAADRGDESSRRLQQQQLQRYQSESDNLRLQQDIRRRSQDAMHRH